MIASNNEGVPFVLAKPRRPDLAGGSRHGRLDRSAAAGAGRRPRAPLTFAVGLRTDSRPIGVFDSGVGGLTVLAELRRRLPAESTLYLGDNARAPYGPRSADEVRAFTLESVAWLLAQDVKLLVLACNTATAQALPLVREVATVPVLGVVRPGAISAAGLDPGGARGRDRNRRNRRLGCLSGSRRRGGSAP